MPAVASGIKQDRIRKLPMVAASASSSSTVCAIVTLLPPCPLRQPAYLSAPAAQRARQALAPTVFMEIGQLVSKHWRSGTGKRTSAMARVCTSCTIVHEQHPQPLMRPCFGAGLIDAVRWTPSLLVVPSTRATHQQSPRTAELALRLGYDGTTNLDRLPARRLRSTASTWQADCCLAQQGWFDMILVSGF